MGKCFSNKISRHRYPQKANQKYEAGTGREMVHMIQGSCDASEQCHKMKISRIYDIK
jgi:hypothetical protein